MGAHRRDRDETEPSRVYTYIVKHDSGHAPNPLHRVCTLATCKPKIRKKARRGDWVMGLTTAKKGHRVAYAMLVDEVIGFDDYWRRFPSKRPVWSDTPTLARPGDNYDRPDGDGGFIQLRSAHDDHERGREVRRSKRRDPSGEHVLVTRRLAYFGAESDELPEDLAFAVPGCGHRIHFTDAQRLRLLKFVGELPQRRHGDPAHYLKDGGRPTYGGEPRRCG